MTITLTLLSLCLSLCISHSLFLLQGVQEMWSGIVRFSFWMKSTKWKNQEHVHSQLQTDNLNVWTTLHAVLKRILYQFLTRKSWSFCLHCICACVLECPWLQERVAQSVSTARPTLRQNAASALAVCAAGSRMLTCSCCVMSATWRFTSTVSTRHWPPYQMMKTGERERE